MPQNGQASQQSGQARGGQKVKTSVGSYVYGFLAHCFSEGYGDFRLRRLSPLLGVLGLALSQHDFGPTVRRQSSHTPQISSPQNCNLGVGEEDNFCRSQASIE
ncbi:hypothetical protein TNCV_311151 [Trichonephila clavipes]|nr:hypothetical protein TNCV_311151 [Trichonephila clavipes]